MNRAWPQDTAGRSTWALVALALLLSGVYAALTVTSFRFVPSVPVERRPVLLYLVLLLLAFGGYFVAVAYSFASPPGRSLLGVVLAGSVVFRLITLPSFPILEVDIYRYIWDGAVTSARVSPYRYSPAIVRRTGARASAPADLQLLLDLKDKDPALAAILDRVHYPELTTIYPPTSQAVFALVAELTPRGTSIWSRIVAMKTAFTLFDLGVLLGLLGLLKLTRYPTHWAICYGWCPLPIKEFANTGHLDSLAVLLTTGALLALVWALVHRHGPRAELGACSGSAMLLALGVGAKLYPLVLVPLFAAVWIRTLGVRRGLTVIATFLLVTAAVLIPMLHAEIEKHAARPIGERASQPDRVRSDAPTGAAPAPVPVAPSGLVAFTRRWEMNDLLFMLLVENVRPTTVEPGPWFVFVPDSWRRAAVESIARSIRVPKKSVPNLLARAVAAVCVIGVSLYLAFQVLRSLSPRLLLKNAFLTIAWLWLFAPTQNPWYWNWALPLVLFASHPAWLAVSATTMLYYVRFWLAYHYHATPVLGTPYTGPEFFDYFVPWLEFGPVLVWIAFATMTSRHAGRCSQERITGWQELSAGG